MDLSQLFLGQKFAQGANSKIYHGIYHNKQVAVKILQNPEDLHVNRAILIEKQFNEEVKILSRMHHPNVVNLVGSLSEKPMYLIVTEFMAEGSLRVYLNKLESSKTRLPLHRVIALALEIARGMESVHSQGIIHRDLKPENILIDQGFQLKVADFGVSCEEKSCDFQDVGTLRWMAAEMIKKEKYTRKVDLYGFGLILNEMISGSIPFGHMSPVQVAYAVANKNMRPEISQDCPKVLRSLIERSWCNNPRKRPEFSEIVKVLEDLDGNVKSPQQCGDQVHKKGLLHIFPKIVCLSA